MFSSSSPHGASRTLFSAVGLIAMIAYITPAHAITFTEWQAQQFSQSFLSDPLVSGPLADPESDGLTNVSEFLSLGDPFLAEVGLNPKVGYHAGHLTLTYRERTDLADLEVWLQGSSDLKHWATFNELEELGRVTTSTHSDITLRDPIPLFSRRFLRLRLVLPPPPPSGPAEALALTLDRAARAPVLHWTDPNVTETGYAVEKYSLTTESWERHATLPPDTIRWLDTNAAGYAGQCYRVVTLTLSGELPTPQYCAPLEANGGFPAWWTEAYFSGGYVDPAADPNGNGVSNFEEYLEGTDPHANFYLGVAPKLQVVSGPDQIRRSGKFLPLPLKVRVLHPVDGTPWAGAPVRFTAEPHEGLLAREPLADIPLAPALTVTADTQGYAQCWLLAD
jgi:hypothetical protein